MVTTQGYRLLKTEKVINEEENYLIAIIMSLKKKLKIMVEGEKVTEQCRPIEVL